MKSIYFIILCFVTTTAFTSIGFSQDYMPFRPDNISFFRNMLAIRVDSVKNTAEGSEFFFQKTWARDENASCIKPIGPSWLGHKCLIQNDGTQQFIIENKDTFTLKPNNPIGESWVIDEYVGYPQEHFRLTGTVVQRTEGTFLGITDSVVVIKLRLFGGAGNEISIPDSSTVEISKNYGIVRIFTFYTFRNVYDDYDNISKEYSQTFEIIGMTDPRKGKIFTTPRQIFDFEVGDEFHYQGFIEDGDNYEYRDYQTIIKVTDKTITNNGDSIIYNFEETQRIRKPIINPILDSLTKYSRKISLEFDNKFFLPYEPIIYNEWKGYNSAPYDLPYYYKSMISKYNGRIMTIGAGNECFSTNDNICWRSIHADGGGGDVFLIEGIGNRSVDFYGMFYKNTNTLVYYKKGDETWGTPVDLTSVREGLQDDINIHPNPIRNGEILNIDCGNQEISSFKITNLLGYEIPTKSNFDNTQNGIAINNLAPGFYYIVIEAGSRIYHKSMLVY